jgi:hypothetical protein
MKKAYYFVIIYLTFLSCSFAQTISGKLKESGYTFFYQATPLSQGKYEFTIKNILKADTNDANFVLAYQSQLQIIQDGEKIKETRIYAAKRNGAMWTIANTECLRLLYDYATQKITSQTVGTSLTDIESAQAKTLNFNKNTLQAQKDKEIIQTIAAEFVRRYYKIFDLGTLPKTNSSKISGEIIAESGEKYSYEVVPQGFGQDEISIRHPEKGLVYRSSLQTSLKDNFTVKILYATRQDISWNIYSSDFWELAFNSKTQTATATKSSLFLPAIPTNKKEIRFKTNKENELTKIAIETFIQTYEKIF